MTATEWTGRDINHGIELKIYTWFEQTPPQLPYTKLRHGYLRVDQLNSRYIGFK